MSATIPAKSFKKYISPQPVGSPSKRKKSGDPGHVPIG